MKTIHAVFENGVFRPTEPVHLPEHTRVIVEPQPNGDSIEPTSTPGPNDGLKNIYAVLGERYESGHTDTATRHNEHQP